MDSAQFHECQGSSEAASALERLKQALLALPDSGEEGFEGLVGALLGAVTGGSFRLAASGSQGGEDGRGELDIGAVSFEAKLYRTRLQKSTLLNKAAEIIASPVPPDIWVLAATAPATTQMVNILRPVLAKAETSLVVLDWTANESLPRLPLLCAMAPETVCQFASEHLPGTINIAQLRQDLALLAAHLQFATRAETLRAELTQPGIAPAMALAANRRLLLNLFSDRQRARQRFGQPLAPAASFPLATIDRQSRAPIDALLTNLAAELVVVTGDQGSGKSWSVAQAWLAQGEPPLTIVLTAAEAFQRQDQSFPTLLARCILEQSGTVVTDAALERWQQRLQRWQETPAASPRLLVVVDGLNERAKSDWAPWLSSLAEQVHKLGGRVIATSRERYFRTLRSRFSVPLREVLVGDLAEHELNGVLQDHNIPPAEINVRVRKALRNPRILSIALELLSSEQIRTARELSIDLLLFEHLRAQQSDRPAGDSAVAFTRILADHARVIRDRVEKRVTVDQLVFDGLADDQSSQDIPRELLPVIDERFFEALEDDPTLYRLTDDGLVHALAIAALRELQSARRNGLPVAERLADLIEPVAVLDKATEVLFAATLIASVDEIIADDIRAALLARLVAQQNMNEEIYDAFCGIVRNAPVAALDALQAVDTAGTHAPHKDWLVAALRSARDVSDVRQAILERAQQWLRLYSLDPLQAVLPGESDQERRSEALARARDKINENLSELALGEREFLNTRMQREDGLDSNELCEDLFLIVSGLPLAPLAEPLVAWAFGRALNSGYRTPWQDYQFLCWHNQADWSEARAALLDAAEPFAAEDTSRVGRWTMVHVLRATGDSEDAARSGRIVETLVDTSQYPGSWRLIEDYCATDPCDPASERPENITRTAERLVALEPSSLMIGRSMSEHDHFLHDVMPSIARFEPALAASKARAILFDLIERAAAEVSPSLNWVSSAAPLLIEDATERMLARIAGFAKPLARGDDRTWAVSQYFLVSAFSHLNGDAQLAALLKLGDLGPPLVQLEEVFAAASAGTYEQALRQVVEGHEENQLVTLLSFALSSATSLSPAALASIRALVDHRSSVIRGLAMELSAWNPDEAQLQSFVDSGWTSAALGKPEQFFERWHGSSLLITAAERGLLSPAEAVGRIVPERFSDLARRVGPRAGAPLAELLARAMDRVLGANLPFDPPPVSQAAGRGSEPARLSLDDRGERLSLPEQFDRLNETDEQFAARQKAAWDSFRAFEAALSGAGAELIIRDIGQAAVNAAGAARPDLLKQCAEQIVALPLPRLRRVVSVAARIARTLSPTEPALAVGLLRHIDGQTGFVRVSVTEGEIPLTCWCAWHSARSSALDAYWTGRLETALSDHDLATEVLAASIAGQQSFIEAFAEEGIASGHPARVARALTILGFGDRSTVADAVLANFAGTAGPIGQAAAAARAAYQRNLWSREWFARAAVSETSDDFWRNGVLLAKIVDGRFALWGAESRNSGPLLERFGWTLSKPIERRIGEWKKKRSDKLFGDRRPRAIYLDPRE